MNKQKSPKDVENKADQLVTLAPKEHSGLFTGFHFLSHISFI